MNKTTLQLGVWLYLACAGNVPAQEATQTRSRTLSIDLVSAYATRHRVVAANEPSREFELRATPVLSWTNPTRGDMVGGVYLWIEQSRPIAYSSISVIREGKSMLLGREFHSLTDQKLIADFDRQRIWTPMEAGVEFKPFPKEDLAGDTTATRLRQMKHLASRFSVSIHKRGTDPERVRLLPTPIYRYTAPKDGTTDGAIFAFVQGNDPEAMLMIEARSDNGGQAKWRYALVRCTTWVVTGRLGDQVVYEAPLYNFSRNDPTAVFVNVPRVTIE